MRQWPIRLEVRSRPFQGWEHGALPWWAATKSCISKQKFVNDNPLCDIIYIVDSITSHIALWQLDDWWRLTDVICWWFYGSYSNFTKSFIWKKKTMSRALPAWHSSDCASFVMRNYHRCKSCSRLHCAVEKLATHEAHNLEIVGANPTCATIAG